MFGFCTPCPSCVAGRRLLTFGTLSLFYTQNPYCRPTASSFTDLRSRRFVINVVHFICQVFFYFFLGCRGLKHYVSEILQLNQWVEPQGRPGPISANLFCKHSQVVNGGRAHIEIIYNTLKACIK